MIFTKNFTAQKSKVQTKIENCHFSDPAVYPTEIKSWTLVATHNNHSFVEKIFDTNLKKFISSSRESYTNNQVNWSTAFFRVVKGLKMSTYRPFGLICFHVKTFFRQVVFLLPFLRMQILISHLFRNFFRDDLFRVTGGVSYTVGGAAAPPTLRFAAPTLCFATPTFGRFGDFLSLKQWFFTLAMQICHICRHFDIQFLLL